MRDMHQLLNRDVDHCFNDIQIILCNNYTSVAYRFVFYSHTSFHLSNSTKPMPSLQDISSECKNMKRTPLLSLVCVCCIRSFFILKTEKKGNSFLFYLCYYWHTLKGNEFIKVSYSPVKMCTPWFHQRCDRNRISTSAFFFHFILYSSIKTVLIVVCGKSCCFF